MSRNKEVYIRIGQHPAVGNVLILTDIADTARDTGTEIDEWRLIEGWADLAYAKENLPTVAEAILRGFLKIEEV